MVRWWNYSALGGVAWSEYFLLGSLSCNFVYFILIEILSWYKNLNTATLKTKFF